MPTGLPFSPQPGDCYDDGSCCDVCYTSISVCFCCPQVSEDIDSGIVRHYMNLDTRNSDLNLPPAPGVPCMEIQDDGSVVIRGSGKVQYRGLATASFPTSMDLNGTTYNYPDHLSLDVVDGDVLSNFTMRLLSWQEYDCIYKHTGYGPGGFTAEGCACFPITDGGEVHCDEPVSCDTGDALSLGDPTVIALRVERAPCVNLGKETGDFETCTTCAGTVQLEIFACKIHGTCTLKTRIKNHGCCDVKCDEYFSK